MRMGIYKMTPGGAAAEAGLKGPRVTVRRGRFAEYRSVDPTKADRLIAIDGTRVRKFDDLLSYVESKKPGDKVKVSVIRDGQQMDVEVKLKVSE